MDYKKLDLEQSEIDEFGDTVPNLAKKIFYASGISPTDEELRKMRFAIHMQILAFHLNGF